MEEDLWVKSLIDEDDILYPLYTLNNLCSSSFSGLQRHEYLLLHFSNVGDSLRDIMKRVKFDPILRLSLWKDSSHRISEDFTIDCQTSSQHCFLFEIKAGQFNSEENFQCFLALDLVDRVSSLPIASASRQISITDAGLLQSSDPFVRDFLCFRLSDQLDDDVISSLSLPRSFSLTLPVRWGSYCCLCTLRPDQLQLLNERNFRASYRLIASYPLSLRESKTQSKFLHLTVEDLTLNQDILELYKHRHLLVRLVSSSTIPSSSPDTTCGTFLGSVRGYEGNWLQSVELDCGSHNSLHHRIEVFTVNASSSNSLGRHLICTGEFSPAVDWNPGIQQIDLFTTIPSVLDGSKTMIGRRIVVGGITVDLSDHLTCTLTISPPVGEEAIIHQLKELVLSKDDKSSQIAAFVIACREVARAPYNPLTVFSNSNFRFFLHSLDNSMEILTSSWQSIVDIAEETVCVLRNHQLLLALLFTANVYFSEWLTTDVAQLILSLRTSSHIPAETSIFIEMRKLSFLLQMVLKILVSPGLFTSYNLTERGQLESLEICDLSYVADISGEFAEIVQYYQLYLVSNLSPLLIEEEITVLCEAQHLIALFVRVHYRSLSYKAAVDLSSNPIAARGEGLDHSFNLCLEALRKRIPQTSLPATETFPLASTIMRWLLSSVSTAVLPLAVNFKDAILLSEVIEQLRLLVDGVRELLEAVSAHPQHWNHFHSLLRAIFFTFYQSVLDERYTLLSAFRSSTTPKSSSSRSTVVKSLNSHIICLIQFYHYFPTGEASSETEGMFPTSHLFLSDVVLRPEHEKKLRHQVNHNRNQIDESKELIEQGTTALLEGGDDLISKYSVTANVVFFLFYLSERLHSSGGSRDISSYEVKLLKLFTHVLLTRHILEVNKAISIPLQLSLYTRFKIHFLRQLSTQQGRETTSPLINNLPIFLKQILAIDQSFFHFFRWRMTFPEKTSQIADYITDFATLFLQSYRYINGCSTLLYQQSTCEGKDADEMFDRLSDITIQAVDVLLSFIPQLSSEEVDEEVMQLLCYLFEVALFWIREVTGIHVLINLELPLQEVGSTKSTLFLKILSMMLVYLQRHPRIGLVHLLFRLVENTSSVLLALPQSGQRQELVEVVTSFHIQVTTILVDIAVAFQTLSRIFTTVSASPSPHLLPTVGAVSSLLLELQRSQQRHFFQALLSSISDESRAKLVTLHALARCVTALYSVLPQLSASSFNYRTTADFIYSIIQMSRSWCCGASSPINQEEQTDFLRMWRQSMIAVQSSGRFQWKGWEHSLCHNQSQVEAWEEVKEEDRLFFESWSEQVGSSCLPATISSPSSTCLTFSSYQQTALGTSLLLRCLLQIYFAMWQNMTPSLTYPLILLSSERHLVAIRDCMQLLLSSGYWEIGLGLSQFFVDLIQETSDQKSPWYGKIEIFPFSFAQQTSSNPNLLPPSLASTSLSPSKPSFESFERYPNITTPHTTISASSFFFPLSPIKSTSLSTPFTSLLSPHTPTVQGNNRSRNLKPPSLTSPLPPTLLLRSQSYSMHSSSLRQLHTQPSSPSPPVSNSPSKRKNQFGQELQRLISKFKDKIKFDGDHRFPKQYTAVRLLSLQEGSEEEAEGRNWSDVQGFQLPISPEYSDFFHRIELFNCVNLQSDNAEIETSDANAALDEGSHSAGARRWRESWIIFSFDMTSYMKAADHYFSSYLESQRSWNGDEGDIPSLTSPIAYMRIVAEIQRLFPKHSYLSPLFSPEKLLPRHRALEATGKYFQCFPAFPAELLSSLQEESVQLFRSVRLDAAHGEDEENEEKKKGLGEGDHAEKEKIESQEMWEVRTDDAAAEMNWIQMELTYNTFYVYALNSEDIVSSTNPPLHPIRRYSLSLPQQSTISLQKVASAIFRYDPSLEAGSSSELSIDRKPRPSNFYLPDVSISALSAMTLPINTEITASSYLDTAYEVMIAYVVPLQRCLRALRHLNELTSTELQNQPEKSLLHSNTLFFYAFDLLCKILECPNQHIIGLANIDLLIVRERERFETEWQRMRKLMKRDYMRAIQAYEDLQGKGSKNGEEVEEEKDRIESTRNQRKRYRRQKSQPQAPKEPDFNAARKEFEETNRLSFIEKVAVLRQYLVEVIGQVVEEMRRFAEEGHQSSKASKFTDKEAREIVQREGRITSTALKIVREQRQIDRLSTIATSVGNSNQAESEGISSDDEASIRLKLILHVEALFSSLVIG